MNKAFKTMIEMINSQIEVLRSSGYKIYDAENLDCSIEMIRYDQEDDMIKVRFIED